MMLQQQPKSATDAAALLLFTSGCVSEETSGSRPLWIYKDHHGNLQGPFSAGNMLQWYNMQRLPPDLLVCGISAQTAQLPLNAIPAKFFQPLSGLISSTAAGMHYSPLSLAKACVQPVPLPQAQSVPGMLQLHQATIPQATNTVGTQMLMQRKNNSNQEGQEVSFGAAGVGAVQVLRRIAPQQQATQMQQQQQVMLQQLTQQPQAQQHQFIHGMPGQQTMVATQQQAVQRPMVLMQPVQQQQVHVQQLPLPGQMVTQPLKQQQKTQQLLLQQLQGGAARVPQMSTGGMMAPTNLQSQQPVQGVMHTQPVTAQLQGGMQQMAMQQAQQPQQQMVVAQQQPPQLQQAVAMQPQQVRAASGPGVGQVAANATADMLLGQQLLERQLQQVHAGARKPQFGACAVAAQAKQYPGAETIQQRLQSVGVEGSAAAHVQQRLEHLAAVVGQQPGNAQSLATPQSNAGIVPHDWQGQQQQQQGGLSSGPSSVGANATSVGATPMSGVVQMQLGTAGHLHEGIAGSGPASVTGRSHVTALTQVPGLLGPNVPAVVSRPGPASTGAISAAVGTPKASGMVVSAPLSGSSFNNLQQLVKQAATGAVSSGADTGAVLSLPDSGMHVAPGPGNSGASADTLAKLAAAAMGTGAAAASVGPASTSRLPAASSLLGMAVGVDTALQVPAAPTSTAGAAQTVTTVHAAGVPSSEDDVNTAIDDILLGLVEDVEKAASPGSALLPSTQVAQQPLARQQAATATATSITAAALAPTAAALAISSSALASGAITPEAVAAALPAVAAGAAAKAMSPLQAQTQAALAQRAAHQIEVHNTTGQRASDFLQQQLAQQRLQLQQQQQGAQARLTPSNQLLNVLGAASGIGATLQPGLPGAAGAMHVQNLPAGLSSAQQQQVLQQQLLAQAQTQAQLQKQQQLLAQQQQQQFLLQQQQQQQKLLAQAQAQQAQQQQQKLLIQQQQQLLAEQQRLQQQQQLREQLAHLQQQQQQQLLAQQQVQQQQLQAHQQVQQQQLQAQQQTQLQKLSHAQLQLPSIPQTQQIQQIQQGTSAIASSSLGLAASEEAKPQVDQTQQQTQQATGSLLQLQQGVPELSPSELLASPVSAGQSSQSVPANASSSGATASEQTRQFDIFGMSFMDPQVMVERPKSQETQATATKKAQQQPQQAPQKPAQQLSEQQQQEIMAALMPELAAMGLTTDQQLEVLKKMLGLKQQHMETQGQAQAAPQQLQPSVQPPAVSSAPSATPSPVSAPSAPAQPPPKPQHVWLQQLAAGKAAGDAKAAAGAVTAGGESSSGGLQQPATSTGAAEPGSDGEGDFDPSMLPADLFDFLDGHSSPKQLQPILLDDDALIAGSAAPVHTWPGDAPQGPQDDQQPVTGADVCDKPAKYVPPSLRRLSAGGSSDSSKKAGDREPRASGGSVQCNAQPAADVQLGRRPSVGAYQPPHARERCVSPSPAGYMAHTSSGGSGWRDDRLALHTTPEQEQRILEHQQRLPPHLRIVPPEAPGRGDDVRDYMWPPPPPPPPAVGSKQPEPATDAAANGRSKIQHLLEKAAAAVHSPRGTREAPPPPPPMRESSWEYAADREQESYQEGVGSSYGRAQQRQPDVPPGFEAPASPRTAWDGHSEHPHRQYRSQQQQQGGWMEPASHHHDEWYGDSAAGARNRDYGSRSRERHANDEAAYWDDHGSRDRATSSYGRHGDDDEYEVCNVAHEHGWNVAEEEPRFAPHYGSRCNPAAGAGSQWQHGSSRRTNSPPPRTHSRDGEGWDSSYRYVRYQEHENEEQEEPYRPHGRSQLGRSHSHHQDEARYDSWSGRPSRGSKADSHHDEWYEDAEDSSRSSRRAAGVARTHMASSRDAELGHDHSMTWQQKLLGDEQEASGGPPTKPGWLAGATAGKDEEGREGRRDAIRRREHSPVDGKRTAGLFDAPAVAPQPSQHLRAAAHTRLKQTDSNIPKIAPPPHPAPYADFLKQLKGEGKQQQYDWTGDGGDAAWPSESPVASPAGRKEAVAASAAAAAMAAVQGLKPFCTVAPPRAGKVPVKKGESGSGRGLARTGSVGVAGIQLPSVEETQAAVMAALGAGPSGASRTSSVSSEQLPPQQDSGSFWRANSSSSVAGGGPDSRESSLTSGQQQSLDAAGTSAPKRGASLFSNVIGQLRKQATSSTLRHDNGCDMERFPIAEAATEADQAPRHTSRVYTSSYAAAASHSAAPPQPSSYLAAASSRRADSDNAAEFVLAAIQTTRQRAHAVSSRVQAKASSGRGRQAEDSRDGKADAAWRDSDTGSAWDTSEP